jgi:hypothetical protein
MAVRVAGRDVTRMSQRDPTNTAWLSPARRRASLNCWPVAASADRPGKPT